MDPAADLTIDQNIDFGSTAAAFAEGKADFTVEFEPGATSLEAEGKGYVVASLGTDSGYVPYTAFSAKKSYMEKNPEIIQGFTDALQKGMDYVQDHTPEEIAQVIEPQFEETDLETITTIVARYYDQDTWKADLIFEEDSFELLQDIYHELFLDTVYSIPCTASGYISNSDMQVREVEKVKNIYEINNFSAPEDNEHPVDHISIEMFYMQQINALFTKFLDEENKEKLINILQEQYNFLKAHILTWLNEFTIFLKEQITQPESNLYYAVAGIMNEFVKYDAKLTEEFLKILKAQE